MSAPVLWQYNISNFNEKARWALDFAARASYPYPEFPGFGELTPQTRHPAMDWIREIYRRDRRPSSAMDA
jgi:hypothetical protein